MRARWREPGMTRFSVIASRAKQSISAAEERVDCFVAGAPRNDGKTKKFQNPMSD
jgi:hypothetical protein